MPPPSPIVIATSAVNRLLQEEATYRQELVSQEKQLERLEKGAADGEGVEDGEEEGNREFLVRQQKKSIEETKAVFAPLRERIDASVEKLERILVDNITQAQDYELVAARQTLGKAKGKI